MKGRIFTLVIVLCIILASCTIKIDDQNMQTLSPKQTVITDSTVQPKVKLTPKPTDKPNPEQTATPVLTPEPEIISYEPLLEIDTSYVDDTRRPSYLVFDDTHMYYIDGKVIKKRDVETDEEEIIFDGVYDNRYLSLQDGWLYLYTKGKGIIKVKTDGTNMEVVRKIQAERVLVVEDDIFFLYAYNPWMCYSLYKYNMNSKTVKKIDCRGDNMCNIDGHLYYSCWDSVSYDIGIYNIKKDNIDSYFKSDYALPFIVDNKAYSFNYYGDSDKTYLCAYDLETQDYDKTENINGYKVYPYYNYLVYKYEVDNQNYLGMYDLNTSEYFNISQYNNRILDMVTYNDALYIVSQRKEKNTDEVLEDIYISKLKIYNGKAVIGDMCIVKNNRLCYMEESEFKKQSSLPININWEDVSFEATTENKEVITYDNKHFFVGRDDKGMTCIYQSDLDGSNENTLCKDVYWGEDIGCIISNDIIYYFNGTLPILHSYNIKTNKVKKYSEIMAYPFSVNHHYQYLIFDNFYKRYCYSRLSNMEIKGQRIAFNMETGEITQLECEYPN